MSNQKLLAALEAAFTGYEKNSSALLLELLADDFTFEMSDSLPYGGSYASGQAKHLARPARRATR